MSIQALLDCAQHQADQLKDLQATIRKYNSSKKENEIEQQKESLLQIIETIKDNIEDLQTKATSVQKKLTGETEEDGANENVADAQPSENAAEKRKRLERNNAKPRKQLPLPEDQEYAYQLKARMMPFIFEQSQNIKAEINLMNKRNELREQRKHRKINYLKETNLSAFTTLKAIQNYERKAKAAEVQVTELQNELKALKGTGESPTSQSFLGPNNRVNDVIKKNECLLDENQDHRKEIQRLKHENADLMKKVKTAQQDRHQMMAHLSTSEMARKDLHTRMQKQKAQHNRLFRSMTRQSADWIEARKVQDQEEEEYRWNNVGYAAPHGAYERTFSHQAPKNVNLPRQMLPVQKYAQSSQA